MIFHQLSGVEDLYFDFSSEEAFYLKVDFSGNPPALSNIILIMDNVGLSIVQCTLQDRGNDQSQMLFELSHDSKAFLEDKDIRGDLEELLKKIFSNEVENDILNKLLLTHKIKIPHIVVLRSLSKYLVQIKVGFSLDTLYKCLVKNGDIAILLIAYFESKFNPLVLNSDALEGIESNINKSIDLISNRDDDIIFRRLFSVITAVTRTNFYIKDVFEGYIDGLCFKIEPKSIEEIPLPVPAYEIFFYSRFVEGVHLRGGKVARGGIRFSDRHEDFRTEVLGLVKAQMVKNSVIVPVGAKGGFVVKLGIGDLSREEVNTIAKEAYRLFIQSLLDITDNYIDDDIVVPKNVVRYDGDDPYLVVAADKGTATFSDFANEIADAYNFWLGDAFASGGKNGYDHKKMGITARGAWESARRLGIEVGKNIDTDPISVVGVGDMSGDVFGNGMLLSNNIRLIAAFNHKHIFIDPVPDPKKSYLERKRLFELPHSSWSDYDKSALSKSAVIISRDQKKVVLSDDVISALGINPNAVPDSPDALIKAILSAEVDMLWNGGIGTYVKSTRENDFDVDDKANDRLRVNACDLRATMVVEGGNLGLTQQARVDYALQGGLIHMDAVDNSAGVDCSDHEVNIKILLGQLIKDKKISIEDRNSLLAEMESSVSSSVLHNNFHQSKMLSQSNYTAKHFFNNFTQLINLLERDGVLDRKMANIPSPEELERRISEHESFARPEIATLLAYSKTRLFRRLVDSDLIEDTFFEGLLLQYFPDKISSLFPDYVKNHPLRKEILASYLTNDVANRMGATFCNYILEEKSIDAGQLIKAHMVTVELFGINNLYKSIDQLSGKVASGDLLDLQLAIHYPIDKSIFWFLKNGVDTSVADALEFYMPLVKSVNENVNRFLPESDAADMQDQISISINKGIPESLAQSVYSLKYLYHVLPLAKLASHFSVDLERIVESYFRIGERLGIFWLYKFMETLSTDDQWKRKNKKTLQMSIQGSHIAILNSCLSEKISFDFEGQIDSSKTFKNYLDILGFATSKPAHNFSMVSILADELNTLQKSLLEIEPNK